MGWEEWRRFEAGWSELGGGMEVWRRRGVHGKTQRSLGINAVSDGLFSASLVIGRLESATR